MNNIMRSKAICITMASVALLGGCAFGTRQTTLIYPPAPEAGAVPVAHVAVAAKNLRIVLLPFVDRRSDTKTVGTVRNGFGARTAEVIAQNSVVDWLNGALRAELEAHGYTVLVAPPTDSAAATDARIGGEVLNVFCDMYFTYTGQVSFISRISRNGSEVLNRHYQGEGSAGVAWGGTAEAFSQSLALAMSAATKQFVADVDSVFATQQVIAR